MAGREVRFSKQYKDDRFGMAFANFRDLQGGVTVPLSDFPQVFARHAIEAIDALAMIAGGDQEFVEGTPLVSPVDVEANALTQFGFAPSPPPPSPQHTPPPRTPDFP